MTIATYTDLKATVANYLSRSDLTDSIPDFIALGEARIFYGSDDPTFPSPPLRIRAMERITDPDTYRSTAGSATVPLPAGLLQIRTVALDTQPFADLDLVSPKQLNGLWSASPPGRPRVYALQGDSLRLGPTPDTDYGMLISYYRRFDPLAVTGSNWLLDHAPGVYLYATLLEAEPFLMHDERLPVWSAMLGSLTRSLMRADHADRFGGSAPAIRVLTETP